MSGGHFDYQQYTFNSIADEIEYLIKTNNDEDEFGFSRKYSKETLDKFSQAIETIRKAGIMAQRIDWLVSSDDSQDSFHERWNEELKL